MIFETELKAFAKVTSGGGRAVQFTPERPPSDWCARMPVLMIVMPIARMMDAKST